MYRCAARRHWHYCRETESRTYALRNTGGYHDTSTIRAVSLDTVMLSLYYRWALQVLSAMHFMHARHMYLKTFSSEFVWLRENYSLTITGFICATSPEIEEEFRRDAIVAINETRRDIAGQSGGIPVLINVDDKDAVVSPGFWDEAEWVGNGTFEYEEVLGKRCHDGSVEEDL
jgi:hypothetical protein